MNSALLGPRRTEALSALLHSTSSPNEQWPIRLREVVSGNDVTTSGHANGFWKITLRRFSDGSRLRLHVWTRALPGNIHNHRWDFSSVVLRGSLTETFFLNSTTSEGDLHSVFELQSNQLRETERSCRLITLGTSTLVPGVTYWRLGTLFHSVAALGAGTISMVATSHPEEDRVAEVLCPSGGKPFVGNADQHELKAEEFFAILSTYL